MRRITIDCRGVRSSEDFWQRYVDVVQSRNARDFGRNLDAFRDAIEAEGPGWPGEVRLTFGHSADLQTIMSGNGRSLLDNLRDLASDATRVEIELA